jgi:hypothetical protein
MYLSITDLFINSFICFGIYKAFDHGMIFGKIGDWMNTRHRTISKPLFTCPICMASVWGSAYFLLLADSWLWMWPVHVLALAGLNRLLMNFSPEYE